MNFATILPILHQSISYYIWFNVIMFFAVAYNRFGCYVISDYPSVTGTVTESRVGYNTHLMERPSTATPYVGYVYEVNGEKYTNQRISPGLDMNDGSYIRDMLRRFPVGSAVMVYYNPDLPTLSFLSKKPLLEPYLWRYIILGNLFMPFIVMAVNFAKTIIR